VNNKALKFTTGKDASINGGNNDKAKKDKFTNGNRQTSIKLENKNRKGVKIW
jgi:hypothetical protein